MILKNFFKEKRIDYGKELVMPRETDEFGIVDEDFMFIYYPISSRNTMLLKHGRVGVYGLNFEDNDESTGVSKNQAEMFFPDLSKVRMKYTAKSLEDYFEVRLPLGSVVEIGDTKYLLTKRSGNMTTLFAVNLDTGMVTNWVNTNDKIGITKDTLEKLFPKYNPLEDKWIGYIKDHINGKGDW
jgi:hypothetical protein